MAPLALLDPPPLRSHAPVSGKRDEDASLTMPVCHGSGAEGHASGRRAGQGSEDCHGYTQIIPSWNICRAGLAWDGTAD